MCSVPRRTWTMTDGAPSAGECGAERSHALPLVADAPEPLLCRGLAEVGAVGSPDLRDPAVLMEACRRDPYSGAVPK